RSSRCSAASFARIASTSAFEIGFAAVAPAAAPADADVVGGEGDGEDGPAAAVTPAACLEPKMADTMFPKTLILSSRVAFPASPAAPPACSCASRAARCGEIFDA